MGDVLHALPALAALRRAEPERWIGWAIEPRWSPLLASSENGGERPGALNAHRPLVNRWHSVNVPLWKRAGLSLATVTDLRALRRELRGQDFGVCVDLQGSIRSAAIGRIAGTPDFVGSATPREAPARLLYGNRVRVHSAHVVEQACELLGVAVGRSLEPTVVELPRSTGAEAWAAERIVSNNTVLLAPTAGWGAKEWPAKRFGAVASALARRGQEILVNAASETDRAARDVAEASHGLAKLVVCSVEQLIALTRRCRLVIAGDTGPLHLAAALGVPVVGLYGPTDPARTGPWGTRAMVLRDRVSVTDHRRYAATEAGLLRITVDEVVSAARELLRSE